MTNDNEKINMKTLSSCIQSLQNKEFRENFIVNENRLVAVNASRSYSPDQVKVLNFDRFEGESDPGDSSILYAIETSDGIKGTLTDAFGTYADENVQKFMANVEEVMKKTSSSVKE